MHAILVTVGTDGDVFPYLALGARLRARGDRVTLVAGAGYESRALAAGLEFQALVSIEESRALFEHPDFWNPLKTAALSAGWGLALLERQYHLLAGLLTPDALIVANPGILAAPLVHEVHGTPWISVLLQPWIIQSSLAPPIMPGLACLQHAPPFVWKIFWRGLNVVGDRLILGKLNAFRRSLGLPPIRRFFRQWLSPQLTLGMFPDWFGPPAADWPSQIRLTGFPLVDGSGGAPLPAELENFCKAGEPPIAFTYGTGMAHPEHLFAAARGCCRRMGKRAIFLTKYQHLLPPADSSVSYCSFASFPRLFPRCAGVVHHGGIGTTALALASGIPQLVRPICFDQQDNGARLKKLGVGDYISTGGDEERTMARALSRLLTADTRARCRRIAQRVDGQEGLDEALAAIDAFERHRQVRSPADRDTDHANSSNSLLREH